MTKSELQEKLAAGETLENLFRLSPGQESLIYKAEGFSLGQEIIYIPDLAVHDLSFFHPATDREEIEDILSLCCTGNDYLEVCEGNSQKAKALFHYCDWQTPSSAAPEIEDDEIEPDVEAPLPSSSMDKDTFWNLIDSTKEQCGQDQNAFAVALCNQLVEMGPQSAQDFYEIHQGYMGLAYKHGLWTAALIALDGCSDDGFIDFRAWLVSQGKDVYMNALENPDSLAELEMGDSSSYEACNYIALDAYEKLTGSEIYDIPAEKQKDRTPELAGDVVYGEGIGYPYEWDEVEAYLPKLCAKYLTPEKLEYNKAHYTIWNHANPEIREARLTGKIGVHRASDLETGAAPAPGDVLRQRVEDSYRDYRASLAYSSTLELIDRASEIARMDAAYSYLEKADFNGLELSYLLKYQDPLRLMADEWPDAASLNEEVNCILAGLADRDDILDYELVEDSVVSQAKESPEGSKDAVTSVAPDDLDGMVGAFFDRVEASLQEHYTKWLGMKPAELLESSREITAIRDAHSYLLDAPDLDMEEMACLLQSGDAIPMLASEWEARIGDMSDFSFALDETLKKLGARQGDIPLDKPVERSSILKKLREKALEALKPHNPGQAKIKDKGER